MSFPGQVVLMVKNTPAKAGVLRDSCLIPGSGRSPGGGQGNPFLYSCLENPTDRGAWGVTVHVVAKRPWTRLSMQGVWMLRLNSNKTESDLKGPKGWSHYWKNKNKINRKLFDSVSSLLAHFSCLESFWFFFFFFFFFFFKSFRVPGGALERHTFLDIY